MTTRPILRLVDTVDSTSEALKRVAAEGMGECALLAQAQTGGRGRLGRRWETVEGNLFLSVLLRPGPVHWPGHWSLLAGVAVAEAVAACLPDPACLRLKWPNDLMLQDGKLAGVLAETGIDREPWLVLGFGVNLAGVPRDLGRPASCLADHGPAPAPEPFARALLATLDTLRTQYAAAGFEPIRSAWLARGPGLGDRLVAGGGPEPIEGGFAGIAPDGALLLDTAQGRRTIVSGELA